MRELRCLQRSSAVQQEGQFLPSKFVCVFPPESVSSLCQLLIVSTHQEIERACVGVCVDATNTVRECVCACVCACTCKCVCVGVLL